MTDDLLAQLTLLEKQLHEPEVRHNPAEVARLLADEFREFGSSGRVYDKAAVLNALAEETQAPIEADSFAAVRIAPGAALLTYRSARSGLRSLRSSLWVHREQRWQLLFHQGTPFTKDPPAAR